MTWTRAAVVGFLVLAMTACSSSGGDSSSDGESSATNAESSAVAEGAGATEDEGSTEAVHATAVADDLKGASPTVTEVVTITEENDPNDLIGRPNGYESAAIIYDSEVSCDAIGSDCGVAVEVFSDEASATARAEYIQAILKGTPALGSEWDYVKGAVLVRVSGELKPSSATKYAEAFGGEEVTVVE